MSKSKRVNDSKFLIQKKSKNFEKFSKQKFKSSLLSAGLSEKKSEEVFDEINSHLDEYFSTALLHKATYKAILKRSKVYAANYDIKRAIYNLGPTGFPFEILCAQMLEAKGFQTQVGVVKQGKYVSHEVDIIAHREDQSLYCECKFHAQKFYKNDIKIPLYVHSRYLDLKEANPGENFRYALISNTQFSSDAIAYSRGVGLVLYSLNYPEKNTFVDHIKKYKVYPITVLKSLRVKDRKKLLEQGIVVIKQVSEKDLEDIGILKNMRTKIMQEIKVLTRPN